MLLLSPVSFFRCWFLTDSKRDFQALKACSVLKSLFKDFFTYLRECLQAGNLRAVVPGVVWPVSQVCLAVPETGQRRCGEMTSDAKGTLFQTVLSTRSAWKQKYFISAALKLKYQTRSTSYHRHNSCPEERKRLNCETVVFTHYFTYN